MTNGETLPLEALIARVEAIFLNAGLSADQTAAVAGVIVAGERDGAKSHGIYRVEVCLNTLRAGKVSATAVPIGDRSSSEALNSIDATSLVPTHGELVLAFDPARFAAGRGTDPFRQAETLFEAIVGQGARLPSERRYAARERAMTQGVTLTAAETDQLDRYQALGLDAVS